jgi:hypothetical protein
MQLKIFAEKFLKNRANKNQLINKILVEIQNEREGIMINNV